MRDSHSRHGRKAQKESIDILNSLHTRRGSIGIPRRARVGGIQDPRDDERQEGEDGEVNAEKVEMMAKEGG